MRPSHIWRFYCDLARSKYRFIISFSQEFCSEINFWSFVARSNLKIGIDIGLILKCFRAGQLFCLIGGWKGSCGSWCGAWSKIKERNGVRNVRGREIRIILIGKRGKILGERGESVPHWDIELGTFTLKFWLVLRYRCICQLLVMQSIFEEKTVVY